MLLEFLLGFSLFIIFVYYATRHTNGFPPGREFDLVYYFFTHKMVFGKFYIEMMKKYGPVSGVKFLNYNAVFVCGREAVTKALLHKDIERRPVGPMGRMLYNYIKGGIIFANEPVWGQQRRFAFNVLKEFGFGKTSMETSIVQEVVHFTEALKDKTQRAGPAGIPVHNLFQLPVMNCLWFMISGKRYGYDDPKLLKLWDSLMRGHKALYAHGAALLVFPFLRFIPFYPGMKHMRQFLSYYWRFLMQTVEEHQKSYVKGVKRDFIDCCLQEIEENEGKGVMSMEKIFPICMDLLTAGADTNVSTLCFLVLYMILYPEIQEKMQKELDEVIGVGNIPTLEDVKRLPYTMAVLQEAQRIGSVVPIQPRVAHKDTEFMGHIIPKGAPIFISPYTMHHDPFYWKDPHVFKPERFLNEKGEVISNESFIPFGIGKRRCAGELFAKNVLFLFVTILFSRYNIKNPVGAPPPSTEIEDGLALHPEPFNVLIEPRC